MGRSVRLAVGAIAAAIAAERVAQNHLAAIIVIALAALLVLGEARPKGGTRAAWPIVIGAGLIAIRLAVLPSGAASMQVPPDGQGPWTLIVESTGSPRAGQQSATLRTQAGVESPFVVAASMPRYPVIVPGDVVVVDGVIRPRPASPYGEYLERIGAVGTLTARTLDIEASPRDPGRRLQDLRRGAAEALARVLPEPEAGLAAGILIGLRDRVDRDLAASFTTAGVSHVVAISGWNIAIVAAAIGTLAGRLGRRRRSVVTVIAIVAYVAFAGASPSVVRAAAMAGVVLLARESGRAGRAAAALGWAATLLLISDPRLIGDAGFQLSSLATAGLIAWATPLSARIEAVGRGKLPRWLAESLGVSFAAQAATLPIVLVSFGRLAVLAPLVNLAVVPLVPPAMAVGLLALVAGAAVEAGAPEVVGAFLAAPGWVVLRLLVTIVQVAAAIPFASLTIGPPLDTMAAAVTVAGLAGLNWWRRRPGAPKALSAAVTPIPGNPERAIRRGAQPAGRAHRAAAVALVIAVAVAGGVAMARPRGAATVTILDVGQGDAVLVEGSRGGRLLVDGGPDPDRLLVALDRRIPPWDRRIDVIVLSHPHEDHVAGLALLLERYRIGRVLEPGSRGRSPGYVAWLQALSSPSAPARATIAAGDRLEIDGIVMEVLWPIRGDVPSEAPDDSRGVNNESVVLLGRVESRQFLLTGDIEEDVDPRLLELGLPSIDLLKVAHHGSRTATSAAFVARVAPGVAVVSVGADNGYGHPTQATLDRLASAGARIFRTDREGTIVVTFQHGAVEVRAEGAGNEGHNPDLERTIAWVPTSGRSSTVGYHRGDDRPRAGGGRRPPALPGSAALVRATCARRGGGGRLAGGPNSRPRRRGGSEARGSRRAAARCRQAAAHRRSCPRAPPRRGLGGVVDSSRTR